MKSYIQFITTPTSDTLGTLLVLCFENKRYLIGNLSEGAQRACAQTGTRMLGMSECFMTGRSEWKNTGGLVGMLLTVADTTRTSRSAVAEAKGKKASQQASNQDIPTFNFHTPPNLNHQMAAARSFVFRAGMPIEINEVPTSQSAIEQTLSDPFWHDQNMLMWPLSILPSNSSKPSNPRKRSYEMIDQDQTEPQGEAEGEDHAALVKGVVSDMFNSTWKLDRLFETRLADVKMPATIFIRDKETHKIEKYTGPTPGGDIPLENPDLQVLVRKPWPGAATTHLPPARPTKEALSYIFRNSAIRGKFDVAKAKALKVPSGPLFSELTQGRSVQNSDGETIEPEQVVGPTRPGRCFAVIDLPDATYIDGLVSRPEWHNGVAADIAVIVWSCGRGVATDERLKTFMATLPDTQHIISSPEHCANYLTFDSAAASTIRLQQVDNERYRVPVHSLETEQKANDLPKNVIIAQRGTRVDLDPTFEMRTDFIQPAFDVQQVINELPEAVRLEAQRVRSAVKSAADTIEAWTQDLPGRDVEVITLGTGSALPSKYRNVSSTLLRVPGWGSMLFDCGEGTLGQLKRVLDADELKQVLQELRIIVISHMHADHHLGTTGVIKAWYDEVHASEPFDASRRETATDNKNMLAIVAQQEMHKYLSEYATMEDYGYSRIAPIVMWPRKNQFDGTVSNTCLKLYDFPKSYANLRNVAKQTEALSGDTISPSFLGLADIQAVHVQHCYGAMAMSLTWPDKFKASYSGDCRPSKEFSSIGLDSTVCIHEATFDDELQSDAVAKDHSTTSEALKVAQDMHAKTCVLTHFSQRYQKLPIVEEDAESDAAATTKFKSQTDMKVCVAFDLMRVKIRDIAKMQYYIPALLKLFEEDQDAPENGDKKSVEAAKKKPRRRN